MTRRAGFYDNLMDFLTGINITIIPLSLAMGVGLTGTHRPRSEGKGDKE